MMQRVERAPPPARLKVVRVERTLLSAAFDFDLSLSPKTVRKGTTFSRAEKVALGKQSCRRLHERGANSQ